MNNDPLTDYLKATQLVLPEYHPLRIIGEGVSKGLVKQKFQTIQDIKDYWVRQYNDAVKFSQIYPHFDFSTFMKKIKNQIDECNKAIEKIIQEAVNDELHIRTSDETKKNI